MWWPECLRRALGTDQSVSKTQRGVLCGMVRLLLDSEKDQKNIQNVGLVGFKDSLLKDGGSRVADEVPQSPSPSRREKQPPLA